MHYKLSRYNNFVTLDNDVSLVYNSCTGSYSLMKSRVAEILKSSKIDTLVDEGALFEQLIKEGIIVDSAFDEKSYVDNIRMVRQFSSEVYHLTVNPTVSCNLHCWYCYENHPNKALMNEKTIEAVTRHLHFSFSVFKFSKLQFSLFGGEPLLKTSIAEKLISSVSAFCEEKSIECVFLVTTNGTLITERFLNLLSHHKVLFQITLDGNREKHNSVRYLGRSSKRGTYDLIMDKLRLICSTLDDYTIRLRVNFDGKTLDKLSDILDDVDFIPRNKVLLGLNKVWQVGDDSIDRGLLYSFIEKANEMNFEVDYGRFYDTLTHSCYADLFCQAVINYDGTVYKCTARDFNPINVEGRLEQDGRILWNTPKIYDRLIFAKPDRCQNCSFYPSCPGLCSQALMEGRISCRYAGENFEDLIVMNYNQHLVHMRNLNN